MLQGLEQLCCGDSWGERELGVFSLETVGDRETLESFPVPKESPRELERDFA